MALLDKLRSVDDRVRRHFTGPDIPFQTVIDEVLGPTAVMIRNRRVLMFGSNNYLGLTHHPNVIAAAKRALDRYGAGTTGSRVANGTLAIHCELEASFARLFGVACASIFTTGFQANLAAITALCGPGDVILLDAESHASLCDAARQSGAQVIWFRHNSIDNLRTKLARLPPRSNRLVVTEGVYSIRGDMPCLRDITRVCQEFGAALLVDEAHAFGVLGPRGLGRAEQEGVLGEVDFIVGTFSKALGGVGGFCVSHHAEMRALPFLARPYLFTASSTPASVAATIAALDVLEREPEWRTRLWANIGQLRSGLRALGFEIGAVDSPIIPVFVGAGEVALALWQALLDAGVYVNLVLPPACMTDACLLRVSCSALHTDAEIAQALEAFALAAGRLSGSQALPGAR